MYISELQGDVLQGPRLHDLGDHSGDHSVGDDHVKAHMGLYSLQTYRTPTLGSETLVLECARNLKREMDAPVFKHVCPGRTC